MGETEAEIAVVVRPGERAMLYSGPNPLQDLAGMRLNFCFKVSTADGLEQNSFFAEKAEILKILRHDLTNLSVQLQYLVLFNMSGNIIFDQSTYSSRNFSLI